jgi:hypothetical protein
MLPMVLKTVASLSLRDEPPPAVKFTEQYDLCLAWNWVFDRDFICLLEAACSARGLALLQVNPETVRGAIEDLFECRSSFRMLIDRASDSDPRFLPLNVWACWQSAACLNPLRLSRPAWDKADMHGKFKQVRLDTPPTVILPAANKMSLAAPPDRGSLGDRFVLKPAHGGGGKGVHTGITTWEQVCTARQEYPADRYLLQTQVEPVRLGGRPAWFRVIYFAGMVYPCWWEPETHIYTQIFAAEEERLSLQPLREIAIAIQRICQLDLFSTEIALTPQGRFLVIDPVNDPIDLRLQSRMSDGLPDEIALAIAEGMTDLALHLDRN